MNRKSPAKSPSRSWPPCTIPLPTPIVLGHEGAGVVEEIGEGVSRIAVGDHVVLSFVPACGECYTCKHDQAYLCEQSAAQAAAGLLDGTTRLTSQGAPLPDAFKGMMVTSDGDGRLIVAFEYDGDVHQVFSLTLEIEVNDRGKITSRLTRARGGELSLPRDTALERIAEIIGGERAVGEIKLMKLFTGQPFGPMDLPIDPGEGGVRNGRITGIEVQDDALHITRLTVARKPAPDESSTSNMPHDE